ncbi:hypothetical protein DFH06DRAFT_1145101 [Mycena polygramma]|nr:hypothetical protein DFH06DRAFT_1145101 [Mycena polygramma]
MSVPNVSPNPEVVNRFWKRVAEVTARYHDADHRLVCSPALRDWIKTNQEPCMKCRNSKSKRVCILDDDSASCKTCREAKIGCDRKTRFLFDVTKDEFFPTLDQFLDAYRSREPGRLRRFNRQDSPRVVRKYNPMPVAHRAFPRQGNTQVETSTRTSDSSLTVLHEMHHLRARTAQLEAVNHYHSVNVQKSAFTLGAISAHIDNIRRIVKAVNDPDGRNSDDRSACAAKHDIMLDASILSQLEAEVGAVTALLRPVFAT